VIVGAGFAGLSLAKKNLKNKKFSRFWQKHNYHTFQPLLYQVATGGLAGSIYPIEKLSGEYDDFFFD
jgi:NADH dehydrogenase